VLRHLESLGPLERHSPDPLLEGDGVKNAFKYKIRFFDEVLEEWIEVHQNAQITDDGRVVFGITKLK